MLRSLISLLLLIALTGSILSRYLVVAGYEINKRYITRNLCENRTRPQLHCNGKCFLVKKLKQADQEEKKGGEKDNLNNLEVSFFQEALSLTFIVPIILKANKSSFPSYTYQHRSSYIENIFRPPKRIV